MSATARVLVVDDDPDFRAYLDEVLTAGGYSCSRAADAVEARQALDDDPEIVIALCDIELSDASGLDLLRTVVADYPSVGVVMVTGQDDPVIAAAAFDLGAYGYLVKPVSRNELLINVASALQRRELDARREEEARGLERAVGRLRLLSGVLDGIDDRTDSAGSTDEETVERLSLAVSLRDEETGRHIERMSRYSALLAEVVQFRRLTAEEVRLATALHDVGKIAVPDGILLKPGPLATHEYASMQRHAQLGYRLLADTTAPLLSVAAEIALSHHEWWDGNGYPRGLRGDEIPEEARIAAIADVFDALTNHRVYRAAIPVDEALGMMRDLRGRQFEPRLLDAFLDVQDDVMAIRELYPDRDEGETRIRVLIVDDHEIFAQSLVRMLGSYDTVKVVGVAGTVADARTATMAYEPDVVLMDFELPDGNGAEATQQIKSMMPTVKVVMLTGRTDDEALVDAIAAGCSGFIMKHEAVDLLLDAIQSAHDGEVVATAQQLRPLLAQLPPTTRGLGASLGARELEVLHLVAAGMPNKQIAERLHLSLNTVRNHVQRILYKLDAHSKLEAIAIAVREGIIDSSRRVASQ